MESKKEFDKNANVAYISRTKQFIDEDGVIGTETEIYKKTYGGKHFWRVWLGDLLQTLGLINNSKQMDVVFYVLDNTDPSNNMYIGTIRETAARTGISTKTVSVIFKKMQEADMITKRQGGVYIVRPNLLMKGDDKKKQRLVINYEQAKNEGSETNEQDA